jgi:hypothetical protein
MPRSSSLPGELSPGHLAILTAFLPLNDTYISPSAPSAMDPRSRSLPGVVVAGSFPGFPLLPLNDNYTSPSTSLPACAVFDLVTGVVVAGSPLFFASSLRMLGPTISRITAW